MAAQEYRCDLCSKSFGNDPTSAKLHIDQSSHPSISVFTCDTPIGENVETPSSIHNLAVFSDARQNFRHMLCLCPEFGCEFVSPDPHMCRFHQEVIHNKTVGESSVLFCTSEQVSRVIVSLPPKSGGTKHYFCPKCNTKFPGVKKLKQHVKSTNHVPHGNLLSKPEHVILAQCEACPSSHCTMFGDALNALLHVLEKHTVQQVIGKPVRLYYSITEYKVNPRMQKLLPFNSIQYFHRMKRKYLKILQKKVLQDEVEGKREKLAYRRALESLGSRAEVELLATLDAETLKQHG